MKKSILNKIATRLILASICGLGLFSCAQDDDLFYPDGNDSDGIKVGAQILGPIMTRSNQKSTPVTSGNYTLTYPYYYANINTAQGTYRRYYQYADVSFRETNVGNFGFANMGTDAAPKELVWAVSTSGQNNGVWARSADGNPTMYLDNIPRSYSPAMADSVVKFTASYNPFVAGAYKEDGSNDLLWGLTSAPKNTPVVHFDLHHQLSMLRIVVKVDNRGEDALGINLKNATVAISNVVLEPASFKRNTGELTLNEATADSLRMVYRRANDGTDDPNKPGWATEPVDGLAHDTLTYETYDYVVPPQLLASDTSRPRLVIRVPKQDVNQGMNPDTHQPLPESQKEVVFSGYIPRSMFIKGDGDQAEVPLILNFLKEYSLTITTSMKPGDPELEFMPVTVEPWVDKGHFSPKGNQAGIGNATEFYELIEYYKANNLFRLGKYGYVMDQATGKWNFQFRAGNVELELTKIQGQMIPGQTVPGTEGTTPPYQVDFRNRYETIVLPDGTKYDLPRSYASDSLYTILTTPANQGVRSAEGFAELIKAYQNNTWRQNIYGQYDKTSGKWTFNINQSIALDWNDIVTQMIPGPKFGLKDFDFNFASGVTVTVENYNGNTSTIRVPEALYNIVKNDLAGIYTADDLYTLTAGFPGNAATYGTQSSGTWTFPIWRSITIDESKIQGMMPGTNYAFELRKNVVTMKRYDGTTTKLSATQLVDELNLPKLTGVTSVADNSFSKMISAFQSTDYKTLLTQFGYYDNNLTQWVIQINSDISLNETDIRGMMPDSSKKYIFSLGSYKVTLTNESGETEELSGDTGAEQLKEITSYVAPTPDPRPAFRRAKK